MRKTTSHQVLALVLVSIALHGCTLPGASSPTPFVFPTPDITLTAMFAESVTPAPLARTSTPAPTAIPQEATEVPEDATPEAAETLPPGTVDTRPNGSPIEADHLSTPPTIDGDLGDWTTTLREIRSVVFGASNWSDKNDASARYYIGWTEEALFLAVRVVDDSFVQVSSGINMFKGDIVELQFDSELEGDFFSNSLSGDDYQIGLSPGNFGSLGTQAWRWYPIGLSGLLTSATVEASALEDGYVVEAKIPWSVFGVTPSAGDRFGFTLSISDNDLTGAPVQQTMVSTVSSRTLTNPTTWGTLVLGE